MQRKKAATSTERSRKGITDVSMATGQGNAHIPRSAARLCSTAVCTRPGTHPRSSRHTRRPARRSAAAAAAPAGPPPTTTTAMCLKEKKKKKKGG